MKRVFNDTEPWQAPGKGRLNIGRVAEVTGLSAKMIRYYELIGLLPAADRTPAGYRVYRADDIEALRFIRRARDFGFAIKEVASLLELQSDQRRTSSAVKHLAARQIELLDERIRELQSMRDTLAQLASECRGDERADCPILQKLSSSNGVAAAASA